MLKVGRKTLERWCVRAKKRRPRVPRIARASIVVTRRPLAERALAASERALAERVLAERVLAERVLAERVLAERALAASERVLAERVLAAVGRVGVVLIKAADSRVAGVSRIGFAEAFVPVPVVIRLIVCIRVVVASIDAKLLSE